MFAWKVNEAPKRIRGYTLEEVVGMYLTEMDHPDPSVTLRGVYRDWMREFLND